MKKFCGFLRKHVVNIHNFEKTKTLPLIKEDIKFYQDATNCYIFRKRIRKTKSKKYCKVRNHCYYTGKNRDTAYSACNLNFNLPNENLVVFHNVSN